MATYSFRNVGKTQSTVVDETVEKTALPIGIKTPLRFGKNELFEMHYALADSVADNFRNLMLTNWGERLGLFDFGADLRPILSDFTSLDDFDTEAMSRINSAISKWMPYIDLEDYTSAVNENNNTASPQLKISITYNVPALDVRKRVLELTLYVM
jgi:phage baseplate assembly protein W